MDRILVFRTHIFSSTIVYYDLPEFTSTRASTQSAGISRRSKVALMWNFIELGSAHEWSGVCSCVLRGCLHDDGATFIPGRDEKLHRVYIKPCLLGCESYSAVKLMKL